VNQRPMRSRGNISPHTLNYGHPPANSYSTILGQAYGKAETEFGLRLAKKFLGQVNTHRPDALVTQDHLVEIIELGDHAWDVCAEEEKTPMESKQMLYSTLLTVLKEVFGIILEPTPTFTLMEDETVEEMMQEELVWRSEMERHKSDVYSLSDEAYAVGGAPVEYLPDRDIPDVDVSDVFDDDGEEDQHKKPTAKEYPSGTIYGHEDKDQHKKCRTEEHTLHTLDGDDNNDQNKKPKAHEYGKG
jgi:hypothetical protein